MTRMAPETPFPPQNLRFIVLFSDDKPAYFRELSGLDLEDSSEYRRGPGTRPIKTPSRPRLQNVILRAGVLDANAKLLKWCEQARTAAVERNTLTIQLLNEFGRVTTTWTVSNAWPIHFGGTTTRDGNEAAVDAIELGFESMTINAER